METKILFFVIGMVAAYLFIGGPQTPSGAIPVSSSPNPIGGELAVQPLNMVLGESFAL